MTTTTTTTRHATSALATGTAVAAALTVLSAVGPTAASAHRADSFTGLATHFVKSAGTVDIALQVGHRKAEMAQYYVDHAWELHQLAAR